ncbi:MAG: hypothetical protein IJ167_07570 [Lachnospiraceae bacterium]|nr:hypothetical protein [Lachnospiraceae bacterium]
MKRWSKKIKKVNPLVIKNIFESMILWITGGLFYFYLEIAYRNYSHYSMIFCGGFCFLIVGSVGNYILKNIKPVYKSILLIMFFGALIITTLELFTGIIVNLKFDMGVWDYSSLKYNVYGQICLGYTLIWALLSLLCVYFINIIKTYIFEK